MVTEKTTCRICGASDLERLLDLSAQPAANAFLKRSDFTAEEYYPLILARCTNEACGFVQLAHVVDPQILFEDYLYVSSTSPVFVKHFEEYAARMDARLHLKDKLVVDIGSNDGILLRPFKALGAKVLGVDPAKKIAEAATKGGIETIIGYFTDTLAHQIVAKHGHAALITANNVFAHIDDLDEVTVGVRTLLAKDGLFTVEAPYLKTFIEKKLFDTIYHEHLSYLAVRPLQAFFKKHEMHIVDVEETDSHGGSVRIMVARNDSPFEETSIVAEMIQNEEDQGLHQNNIYRKFVEDIEENRHSLVALLSELKSTGKRIAGYGAPAKGNTLLNYMNIGADMLDYIVDDSPLKQGLYTPGMHIPVVSSASLHEDPPDYLFILAWNFADSIMGKNEDFRAHGGKFIVPVPTPRIVE